jgi:hypothetical protein
MEKNRAYFDFKLILNRIKAENVFVARIKTNTVYQTLEKLELTDKKDEHILKGEIIKLTSVKANQVGIS